MGLEWMKPPTGPTFVRRLTTSPTRPEFTVATFRVDGVVFDISVDAHRARIESIAQRQGADHRERRGVMNLHDAPEVGGGVNCSTHARNASARRRPDGSSTSGHPTRGAPPAEPRHLDELVCRPRDRPTEPTRHEVAAWVADMEHRGMGGEHRRTGHVP